MNKGTTRLSRSLTVLAAVLYALCGLIWLGLGLGDPAGPDRFRMALGLVWLAGAAVWAVRAVRAVRERREEKESRS